MATKLERTTVLPPLARFKVSIDLSNHLSKPNTRGSGGKTKPMYIRSHKVAMVEATSRVVCDLKSSNTKWASRHIAHNSAIWAKTKTPGGDPFITLLQNDGAHSEQVIMVDMKIKKMKQFRFGEEEIFFGGSLANTVKVV